MASTQHSIGKGQAPSAAFLPATAGTRAQAAVDTAAYWLTMGGIYVVFASLWYYAFKEKLFDDNGTAPPPIAKQFHGTVIDSFPGMDAVWTILGILELIALALFVASVVRLEFMTRRPKPFLLAGMGMSILTFAVMLFGQNLTKQFDSVAQLFAYAAGTGVLMLLVQRMSMDADNRRPES